MESLLRWTRDLFIIVGILSLGYVAYALLDAQIYQTYENWRFNSEVEASKASGDAIPLLPGAEDNGAQVETPATAGAPIDAGLSLVGRIEIKSIGLAAMIMEGVDSKTLRRAVGHIPGTPLPGQTGNVALAGHRDTFFRGLRNIHKDDEITLETLEGSYRYRVDLTQVVSPEYTEALDSSSDAILTLVTCYPFSYVGPAPRRFIVRAHRVL